MILFDSTKLREIFFSQFFCVTTFADNIGNMRAKHLPNKWQAAPLKAPHLRLCGHSLKEFDSEKRRGRR